MFAGWLFQRRTSEASIVDAIWALGIGSAIVFYAFFGIGDPARRGLVGLTGGWWGYRLGTFLLRYRVIGKPEDPRYRKLRELWDAKANRNFFFVFQFQALLVFLFSLPAWVVCNDSGRAFGALDWLAVAVALGAIGGETLADRQLAAFRSNPENKGRTCRRGLWRYTRHPNYFFEWLHWFGYVIFGIGAKLWIVTLGGPVLMFWFLYKITGIPWTEEQAVKSRGDDYRDYQRTTSMFFPWFTKE